MSTCSASSPHSQRNQSLTSFSINLLPVELLVLIFTFVVSSSGGTNTPFHLAWVCRYWRRIVFRNSQLWAIMALSFRSQGSWDLEYKELVSRMKFNESRELVLLGPSADDIQDRLANWTIFYEFLFCQSNHVGALLLDGLPQAADDSDDSDDGRVMTYPLPGLASLTFENLGVLSIVCRDAIQPINFEGTFPNLQSLHLTTYSLSGLPSFSVPLPSGLTTLVLNIPFDKPTLEHLLIDAKDLKYLSIFLNDMSFRYPLEEVNLPNLRTFKTNGSFELLEMVSSPALKHLEINTPRSDAVEPYMDPGILTSRLSLSPFTHLYIGYTIPSNNDIDNLIDWGRPPVDGCIWASIGSREIPCLSDQPTIFRNPYDDHNLIKLPSLWSSSSGCDDESLVHIHTPGVFNFTEGDFGLTRRLVAEMRDLETLVLCFPDSPYPNHSSRLWGYDFHLSPLFYTIVLYNNHLLHLVIRTGSDSPHSIELLSGCLDKKFWSTGRMSHLESITYHAPVGDFSEAHRDVYWEMWANFITLRQHRGQPLPLLHLIGGPGPSPALSKLEKLSNMNITKVVIEDPDCSAFSLRNVKTDKHDFQKLYPTRGF